MREHLQKLMQIAESKKLLSTKRYLAGAFAWGKRCNINSPIKAVDPGGDNSESNSSAGISLIILFQVGDFITHTNNVDEENVLQD